MALPRHRLLLLTAHCHSYKPSLPCTSSIKCTSARYSFSTDSNQDDDNKHSLAGPMHSLLRSRRTATRLVHSLDDSKRQQEQDYIAQALNRAVACAQMAPNHKRTEPFSFKKIMASSQSAQTLAEISYQITLNKSSSSSSQPVAERKRQKWLEIPAFLVALIHDNQDPFSLVTCDNEAFQELPFMPPKTERQLEDYAAACAATQNVLLSLHAEGIGSKWATGPTVCTTAFRELVGANPTDRIGALVMVGGVNSTNFLNDREEQMTSIRRMRRRALPGDLLMDLP